MRAGADSIYSWNGFGGDDASLVTAACDTAQPSLRETPSIDSDLEHDDSNLSDDLSFTQSVQLPPRPDSGLYMSQMSDVRPHSMLSSLVQIELHTNHACTRGKYFHPYPYLRALK